MSEPTTEHAPRVALVGSGPSGFYAAEALLKSGRVARVDIFERLAAPFGLVRYGVAPDHPKLKEATQAFEVIARLPGFNWIGNVTVGRDVSVEELRARYHAVVFTCGAQTDRALGIPGEELPGSHTATEFVAWYNGHPDYQDRHFDLSQEVVAVVGQGNVAADVCRMLAKSVDELRSTDITERALDALAESRVREIHLIGRRGPGQAKFTNKELRELGELADCDVMVAKGDLELDAVTCRELEAKTNEAAAKNMQILRAFAAREASAKRRRLFFHFLKSPLELSGDGRVEHVALSRNRLEGEPFQQVARATAETDVLRCGLLFRSIGYAGIPIPGVPFDARRGVFPTEQGRIVDPLGTPLPGLYAAGWIKRGPSGIIGTNRADSVSTVKTLLSDLERLGTTPEADADGLQSLLTDRGVRTLNFADWRRVDAAEVMRGQAKGKPREKFTTLESMLAGQPQMLG